MLHIKLPKPGRSGKKKDTSQDYTTQINAETAAVITLALHLHIRELEEAEKDASNLRNMMPPYSPWSSRYHNLTPTPVKIPRQR